jgi:hypothetical protein
LFPGGVVLRIENENAIYGQWPSRFLDDGYRNTAFESASVDMQGSFDWMNHPQRLKDMQF